jgi:putative pyrroloquinoline-quinone binding quinoprotein
MVAGVPLIDLDRPWPAPDPGSARERTRPALLLVALVAVLLALGGAAPVRRGLTPVLSVDEPITSAALGAGSLFLATPKEVRRYALPAGTRDWTAPSDLSVQNLWVDEEAGVVLVLATGDGDSLTALDARSGRRLWSRPAGDTLVITLSRGGLLTQTGFGEVARLTLNDSRTGRERWSREVDPAGFLGPDDMYEGRSSMIVAVGATGSVVVLSYADGSVLADGVLELSLQTTADHSVPANFTSVSVVGDRLYLSRRVLGRVSLAAYSVRPLAELWRSEGGPTGTVSDCGPVLCVADTRWVTGVDPAGGGVRWEQPAWGVAYRYDEHRLFAYDNQEDARAALLDAASGRLLRPLGQSRQLGDLILRTDGSRTFVTVPDPATGDLRTVGSMVDVAWFRCQAGGDYLVCPTLRGVTAVWRIN